MLHPRSQIKSFKQDILFKPDESKVIAKRLHLEKDRSLKIIEQICGMPEDKRQDLLNQILRNYEHRHKNLKRILKNNLIKLKTN